MLYRRDPSDRRFLKRLGLGYLASVLLHVVFAALFFAVVANSSQQSANENIQGGSIVTLESRAPVVAAQPSAAPPQAAPVPHAPFAEPHHAPALQPPHQQQPPAQRELSKFAPTAPPQPTPAPQTSQAPLPLPTTAAIEPKPQNDRAAVPVSVPSAAAIAVALKVPPTAAPSPAPSAPPSPVPSAKPVAPTAAPSVKPTVTAAAVPTIAPTPSATAASTTRPTAAAVAQPVRSAAPAPSAGVPSPLPTAGAAPSPAKGPAPTPGPSGRGTPGPKAGTGGPKRSAPAKPVAVRPTPSPPPAKRVARTQPAAPDLNARLRAMLPSNGVVPVSKSYTARPSMTGRLEPTPPPEVVARTKYLLDERDVGGEARIKMWVTAVRGSGPSRTCTGWLVRFPEPLREHTIGGNLFNLGNTGGTLANGMSGLAPIVEENATTLCPESALKPFAGSATPSP